MMKDEIVHFQIKLMHVNIFNDFDIVECCTFILYDQFQRNNSRFFRFKFL